VSKEQDQINEFKVMVEALSKQVKGRDDLGLAFIDKLSMQFDDHLAHQNIYPNESGKTSGVKSLFTKLLIKLGLQANRLFSIDPVIQNFINELSKTGVITTAQFELLRIYRMIRVDDDGSYFVMQPRETDYKKAKLQALLLLILTPFMVAFVWDMSKCIYPGLPTAFILGSALGLLWQGTYNLAWGREKLAKFIVSRYLWFKLVK